MDVPTLDSRILRVPLKEVVRPGYERLVAGEGEHERCAGLCCTAGLYCWAARGCIVLLGCVVLRVCCAVRCRVCCRDDCGSGAARACLHAAGAAEPSSRRTSCYRSPETPYPLSFCAPTLPMQACPTARQGSRATCGCASTSNSHASSSARRSGSRWRCCCKESTERVLGEEQSAPHPPTA